MQHVMKKKQKGFTLIETLLYLALSVIMVALIGGIGVNVLTTLASAKAEEELQYNAQFITEKIRMLVSEAEGIDAPLSGATSTVLSLAMSNSAKNPTTIEVVDGRVFIQEGSETPQVLSGSSVVVSALTFSNVTNAGGVGAVRIGFDMGLQNADIRPASRTSTSIYTTVNLQYP